LTVLYKSVNKKDLSFLGISFDILRGYEMSGCGLETTSFTAILKEDESRRHGMCSVSMTDKASKKYCKFYQCSECVCKDRTDRKFK